MNPSHTASWGILNRRDFPRLLDALRTQGYRIIGPTLQDGAVKWGDIATVDDFPVGWRDHQSPGHYRLERTESFRYFDIVHGAESFKPLTFAPRETLLVLERTHKTFVATPILPDPEPLAVLGVRACDLAGLAIQDRIFLHGPYADPYYRARRDRLFIIAVQCTRALDTCFCASMGTGPQATAGFDLALIEGDADFVVQTGSEEGARLAQHLSLHPVPPERLRQEEIRMAACAASQTRSIDQSALPRALYDAHDHERWDDVARRCLACTNCTMVCPTCFCHGVEEQPDLMWTRSERARVWDSCFTPDHGYIHGKNLRPTIKDRYRMWLTHKLAAWIDQFGMSGCVGCGRCLTWCPVGIDLTEEIKELIRSRQASGS
ncbi:MAG: sulfite reductase subunit A [Nitrospirae bacterium]|nr:MAG: sulfite reductase subunit A [Nitrospirota bacterium]